MVASRGSAGRLAAPSRRAPRHEVVDLDLARNDRARGLRGGPAGLGQCPHRDEHPNCVVVVQPVAGRCPPRPEHAVAALPGPDQRRPDARSGRRLLDCVHGLSNVISDCATPPASGGRDRRPSRTGWHHGPDDRRAGPAAPPARRHPRRPRAAAARPRLPAAVDRPGDQRGRPDDHRRSCCRTRSTCSPTTSSRSAPCRSSSWSRSSIFALGGGAVADAVDRRRLLILDAARARRPAASALAVIALTAGAAARGHLRRGVRRGGPRVDRPAGPGVRDPAPRPARAAAGGDRPQPAGVQRRVPSSVPRSAGSSSRSRASPPRT